MPPVIGVIGAIHAILVSAELGIASGMGLAAAEGLASAIMLTGAMAGFNAALRAAKGAMGKPLDAGRGINVR